MNLQEYNTKLLLHVASFMAKNGIVDISYNQLEEIINCLEEDLLSTKSVIKDKNLESAQGRKQ